MMSTMEARRYHVDTFYVVGYRLAWFVVRSHAGFAYDGSEWWENPGQYEQRESGGGRSVCFIAS